MVSSKGCSQCGTTKKSSTLSCCARGGAWFKNCGDAGDTDFEHTWSEGIQACKGFAASGLVKPTHLLLRHVGVITYPLNVVQPLAVVKRQTNIHRSGTVSNGADTHSRCRIGLVEIHLYFVYLLSLADAASLLFRIY